MRAFWFFITVVSSFLSGCFYQDDGEPLLQPPVIFDRGVNYKPAKTIPLTPYNQSGATYQPSYPDRTTFIGQASWYGRYFHGNKTASGEKYDLYRYSAAHKTLPIPSFARVVNLKNNKSIIVRINDRGPFVDGREIDLSWAAARKLGFVDQGVTEVKVQWLGVQTPNLWVRMFG